MPVEVKVILVNQHWRSRRLMQLGEAAHVVNVRVRADDGADVEAMPCEDLEDAFDLIARVKNNRLPCITIP